MIWGKRKRIDTYSYVVEAGRDVSFEFFQLPATPGASVKLRVDVDGVG